MAGPSSSTLGSTDDSDDAASRPRRGGINRHSYEIESVRGHRRGAAGLEYLVHWRGWPDAQDCWMTDVSIPCSGSCRDIVAAYNLSRADGD